MLYLEWSKSDKQIKVKQGPLIWYMDVSCVVRNELNGWRPNSSKDPKKEVVYGITEKNILTDIPVMPRQFPIGKWQITDILARKDPTFAPYAIVTNAHQELDIWSLNKNGGYKSKTMRSFTDWQYYIHCSVWNTTQGCIKAMNEDHLVRLVSQIRVEFAKNIFPMIEVVA